ncbi:MAG: ABC transporter permease [Prevotella sp.]|nr:ABC transporter permease [Prevotella sp.]
MKLKFLIRKEFIQMFRNPFIPKLIFLFPIVIVCVMPWVMSMEVKNIKVQVVDNDHSSTSQRLIQRIEASNYFLFRGTAASNDEALKNIERGDADIVLEVPYQYERDLTNNRHPQVLITANAGNATKGGMGANYLAQIVTASLSQATLPQLQMTVVDLYNPHLSYKVFMIPALMGILIMLLCGFLPALNIVGEKESGTIEQINVTPVKKWEFILAKLIPYWLVGMLVMTFCILLAWAVYGITCQGNLLLVYLLALLLAFFFSGLGLVVSNYSDTMQQAVFVMWFFVVIMLLMSGMFTPVASMPDWAQTIVLANPMHYFMDAIRTVFVRGGDLHSIATQLVRLGGIAILIDLWAVGSYRKNNK